MSKASKKTKARKTREKRANEEERLKSAPADQAKQAEIQPTAGRRAHGKASNAYANVAGMGAATVGQLKLFRLMNLFTIVGTLSLAAAVLLGFFSMSDEWAAAALNFLGYAAIDQELGSPGTLIMAESGFGLALGLLCLLTAGSGRAWLRGAGTYKRFLGISEVCGALAIIWVACCFFIAHLIEPLSSIVTILFLVTISVVTRLHREGGVGIGRAAAAKAAPKKKSKK